MHCGYVVKVTELRKHSNADRLQVATFFGNDTIVDLSVKEGDIGVYFPVDLQLSEEYCAQNNLVRKKDENGNNIGGFLDPDKRNIKAIKLRGEKSDGLFMPITSFAYCYDVDLKAEEGKEVEPFAKRMLTHVNIGGQITILNGHEICKKYIPKRQNRTGSYSTGNHTRKTKVPYSPLFAEHADTEQLAYNHGAFKAGDEVEITLKMHGTSQRTGYLPVLKEYKDSFLCCVVNKIQHIINKIVGQTVYEDLHNGEPVYEYDYVSGTRRVVMEDFEGSNSFYGSNEFREQHHNAFVGKLNKGETVYYEVVGFTHTGVPIMADGSNKGLDKEFIKMYGETTRFSYGCSPDGRKTMYGQDDRGPFEIAVDSPQSDLYVYRMTMTNEDGFVVDYTPDFMRYRCEQMGVKTVQVFEKFTIPADCKDPGQYVQDKAEKYYDGPDPVGKTHIREGVVCRILNRPKFAAFKHKNFSFKCVEGLIKDTAASPDLEEDQEVT